jgi:hypothetical protein
MLGLSDEVKKRVFVSPPKNEDKPTPDVFVF